MTATQFWSTPTVCGILSAFVLAVGLAAAQSDKRVYTVTPMIPGVVAAGTAVELLHDRSAQGYRGTD